ncbi:MAG: BrnT family toxin [Chloroflexales bacterium]|nr:BrnT family toxin [Chloroflexales bacterium]
MDINEVVCSAYIEEKLASKHHITIDEVQQIFWSAPRVRFVERGYIDGEDVYAAFGQTFGGCYVSVFFVYKPSTATAIIMSARDMSMKERRAYGRK